MKPGTKFFIGAVLIVSAVTYMIYEGVKQTGTYFFTPTELAERTAKDPTFHNVGVKMGAKVVPGTIRRNTATQTIDFRVTDGLKTYPVTYRGLAPDTFTDTQDNIEVVVEGRLGSDGVFHATTLLAKCGSKYEAKYQESDKKV
jgi:cytochrome c-type biogenesis protein CcmE